MFKDFYDFYDALASKANYNYGKIVAEEAFRRFRNCQAILEFLERNKGHEFSAKEIAENLEIKYGKCIFTTNSVAADILKLEDLGLTKYRVQEYQIKIQDDTMENGEPHYKFIDCRRKIYSIA